MISINGKRLLTDLTGRQLRVVKEVTEDARYTNSALAEKLPED